MPNIASELVEVYVFRVRNTLREYLLLQRSHNDELYPGIWQVVTGTLQENETALECALRELREETGYKTFKCLWNVPIVNSFYDAKKDAVQLVPIFAIEIHDGTEPMLSPEHKTYRWETFKKTISLLAWPTQRWGVHIVNTFIGTHEPVSALTQINAK
ncbi:MAG: NUDIX domain-containing protein [Bacteroidetes bacterium]|nr:NUDIX domain-containing protein [Bacteroidota bacterium]